MTRFRTIGDKVEYEMAQKSISVSRVSGDSSFPGPGEIQVFCLDTVRIFHFDCILEKLTLSRRPNCATMSPPPD